MRAKLLGCIYSTVVNKSLDQPHQGQPVLCMCVGVELKEVEFKLN